MATQRPVHRDSEIAVRTFGLRRRFGGKWAVDGLNVQIEKGDICGFIGPNGAGKTTTLRMVATLLEPTTGTAKVFGYDVRRDASKVRRLIGFMPDQFGLYRDMVAGVYLDFFGAAYGLSSADRKRVIQDVLALTDLAEKSEVPISSLSRGMQQRLSLARVLVHDPDLLLLDEPASGLDPRARIEVRALLSELQQMGKTIFISSHILTELAEICNKVVIIEEGRTLFSGSMDELRRKIAPQKEVRIELIDRADEAAGVLLDQPWVSEVATEEDAIVVTMMPSVRDHSPLAELLVGAGFRLLSMNPVEDKLEDAFMKITEGKVT